MFEEGESLHAGRRRGPEASLCLLAALAGGCFAFGAKLMLIHRYGTDVPFWDEWDAVGGDILVPMADHRLHAADFLLAHNEHRIVLTRLMSYALAVWNGQWDPLLEMSANAALHSGICAALILFAGRLVSGARFAAVAVVTTALFSLAFDWENTLQGFQSQFYFLEWGAMGMLLLCVPAVPLGARWWLGWLVGVASLGTMASGFLAASAVLAVAIVRACLEGRWSRRDTAAASLLVVLCILGCLSVARVPGHDAYRAHSPAEWGRGVASLLSWPISGFPAAFLAIQAPACVLFSGRVRLRRLGASEAVLMGLVFWSWLQMAAISYGRVNLSSDSPRYTDLLAVGLFANGLSLFILWEQTRRGILMASAAAVWLALVGLGLRARDHEARVWVLGDLPSLNSAERSHIRAFLADGDIAELGSAPARELPYPLFKELGGFLSARGISSMLPLGIRPAVALVADSGSSGFAVTGPRGLPSGAEGRIWIARTSPARFVSKPLPVSDLPFLHLEFCGSSDLSRAVLHLESADGDEYPLGYSPLEDRWQTVDLSVPRGGSARLVVEVPARKHWFAFTEPVELGRGSWANRWLLRRSEWVAALSGILLAGALVTITFPRGRRENP
jgi:hypothetical protein